MSIVMKQIVLRGSIEGWGITGAQIVEHDTDTGHDLPARKLGPADFPDILGASLADTVATTTDLQAQKDLLTQDVADRDAAITALNTQITDLNTQIGVLQGQLPDNDLTRRQLKLGMLTLGITEAMVDAVIDAMPENGVPNQKAKQAAMIEWKDGTNYSPDHPLMEQLRGALNITLPDFEAAWSAARGL